VWILAAIPSFALAGVFGLLFLFLFWPYVDHAIFGGPPAPLSPQLVGGNLNESEFSTIVCGLIFVVSSICALATIWLARRTHARPPPLPK